MVCVNMGMCVRCVGKWFAYIWVCVCVVVWYVFKDVKNPCEYLLALCLSFVLTTSDTFAGCDYDCVNIFECSFKIFVCITCIYAYICVWDGYVPCMTVLLFITCIPQLEGPTHSVIINFITRCLM